MACDVFQTAGVINGDVGFAIWVASVGDAKVIAADISAIVNLNFMAESPLRFGVMRFAADGLRVGRACRRCAFENQDVASWLNIPKSDRFSGPFRARLRGNRLRCLAWLADSAPNSQIKHQFDLPSIRPRRPSDCAAVRRQTARDRDAPAFPRASRPCTSRKFRRSRMPEYRFRSPSKAASMVWPGSTRVFSFERDSSSV